MTLTTYPDIIQGTDEWHDLRRGLLTASTVGKLITPKTIKVAANMDSRALVSLLVSERITGWTDPSYYGDDMERGHLDEPLVAEHYTETVAPVTQMGFLIRDDWGFSIGYSPDGLVGDEGLIETKSRRPRKQTEQHVTGEVPVDDMAQIQCGLLVSGRSWCDYLTWCGGMPMFRKRVFVDDMWQDAIVEAATAFEASAEQMLADYNAAVEGLPTTERIEYDRVELKL